MHLAPRKINKNSDCVNAERNYDATLASSTYSENRIFTFSEKHYQAKWITIQFSMSRIYGDVTRAGDLAITLFSEQFIGRCRLKIFHTAFLRRLRFSYYSFIYATDFLRPLDIDKLPVYLSVCYGERNSRSNRNPKRRFRRSVPLTRG